MQRVITYIDGFNLYFGLREKDWKWFYWLNIQAMSANLLKPHQSLVLTRYFTTIVHRPESKRRRQAVYLEALETLSDLTIDYGHFLADTMTCSRCGHTYDTYHEKMTDVNIAINMMTDAHQDRFDTALLVSADSDLVGPVKSVRALFPAKRVIVAFPPGRSSKALMAVASGYTHIGPDTLSKSVFPDEVVKADGYILRRPPRWR
jgi:uncharacterized LabA/DUF88 family protein